MDLSLAAVRFTLLDKLECKSICFSCSEQINEYLTECEYISAFFFKHRCPWEAAKERG